MKRLGRCVGPLVVLSGAENVEKAEAKYRCAQPAGAEPIRYELVEEPLREGVGVVRPLAGRIHPALGRVTVHGRSSRRRGGERTAPGQSGTRPWSGRGCPPASDPRHALARPHWRRRGRWPRWGATGRRPPARPSRSGS